MLDTGCVMRVFKFQLYPASGVYQPHRKGSKRVALSAMLDRTKHSITTGSSRGQPEPEI